MTTDHTPKLYALAGSILGLFLAWAGIAAHPWAQTSSSAPTARSAALVLYQRRLNADATLVARLSARRSVAPAASVRVVTLPPAHHDADLVMLRHAFRAMGTEVELLLDAQHPSLLTEAEAEFRRLEGIFSRFRPDSELSRLNEAGVRHVGPELFEVIELAVEAREASCGRFDPTVHAAIVAAGYDRSFEQIDDDVPASATAPARMGGAVAIDHAAGRVAIEPGYRLDLGGIAKGWTADRVRAVVAQAGPTLVNAGGDIAASGRVWPIAVEAADEEITLGLDDGGVATSGRDRRSWVRDGRAQHHLIDPVTGLPAGGDILTVTVAAGSASEAEVLAKTLFLAGDSRRALDEAELAGIPTVLVTSARDVLLAGGLR